VNSVNIGEVVSLIEARVKGYSPDLGILGEDYSDKLVGLMRSNSVEWFQRFDMATTRLITASSFKISSLYTLQATDSSLLPAIGLYYSVFHLGIACLNCYHGVGVDDTKHSEKRPFHHSKLIGMLKGGISSQGFIPSMFANDLETLRDFRERANYAFPVDDKVACNLLVHHLTVQEHFEKAISFIKSVENVYESRVKPNKRIFTPTEYLNNMDEEFMFGGKEDQPYSSTLIGNYLSEDMRIKTEMFLSKMGFS